jgi:hypothetical protein
MPRSAAGGHWPGRAMISAMREEPDLLRRIKSSLGAVSLSTMTAETEELTAIASFDLPPGLFADAAPAAL